MVSKVCICYKDTFLHIKLLGNVMNIKLLLHRVALSFLTALLCSQVCSASFLIQPDSPGDNTGITRAVRAINESNFSHADVINRSSIPTIHN